MDFPVHSDSRRRVKACPRTVPWGILAPHEAQALRNHSQTLKRLAERGGLALCEMCAIIEERRWRSMDDTEAYERVLREIEKFNSNGEPDATYQDDSLRDRITE